MIDIRAMTAADLPLGVRLTRQAGWNQTEADWRRLLDLQPDGCFVALLDDRPVGTTTTCTFGPVAWVAMVLVDAAARGRGVGTALLAHALEHLDASRVPTVRLDATPLGQPLYDRLGFAFQGGVARYEGVPRAGPVATGLVVLNQENMSAVAEIDRRGTGTDRRRLLDRLAAEHPDESRGAGLGGPGGGFLLGRPGSLAVHIGPCIGSAEAGPLLLADALQRHHGRRVLVDVPLGNTAAIRLAEQHGLTVQRQFARMCRGDWVEERWQEVWASSGPEMG